MKKSRYIIAMFMLSTILIACSNNKNSNANVGTNSSDLSNSNISNNNLNNNTTNNLDSSNIGLSNNNGNSESSSVIVDKEFTGRDLEVGYDTSQSTSVVFNLDQVTINGNAVGESTDEVNNIIYNDSMITIKKEGTYILTGIWNQGQLVVDVDDSEKVQIVLDNVSIKNQNNSAIYVKSADKVFITMADGSKNTLEDGETYIQNDENTVDGVIFSKSDLTMNGEGNLNIKGNNKHGIVSKDELIITSGAYVLDVVKDGLNSKEGIKIKNGSFTINSKSGNGLQAKNGDDETQGYIYIEGGNIDIASGVEGIEATAIVIDDGTIHINVTDDGMNASQGTSESEEESNGFFGRGAGPMNANNNCYIEINGGKITIVASGDGIDSNGNLYITGGTVYVNGSTNGGNGALDYDGTANITGGLLVALGSTGMSQGFSSTSSQYSIHQTLSSKQKAGSDIILVDSSGKELISYTAVNDYQAVVLSSPEISKDSKYTIKSGELSEEITISDIISGNAGSGGMGGFGGFGGNPGNKVQEPPTKGKGF